MQIPTELKERTPNPWITERCAHTVEHIYRKLGTFSEYLNQQMNNHILAYVFIIPSVNHPRKQILMSHRQSPATQVYMLY